MMARARRSAEAGETLVELLVTIAIIGLAVVALVGGMGTAIMASDGHRQHATGDTVARSVAELLKNRDPSGSDAYVDCAGNSTYPLPDPPTGLQIALTVKYWNGSGSSVADGSFTTTCPSPDLGLQQIKITVTSPAKGEQETVTVLKRRT